jgi:hypothetical protein
VTAPESPTPLRRFLDAMPMDAAKWRDGVGHDLAALAEASPAERTAIEAMLLARPRSWREVEALAALDTPGSRQALRQSLQHADPGVRLAVTRYAPRLASEADRTAALVMALEQTDFYGGLTQALEEAATWHPAAVQDALWRGLTQRTGDVAVHFAALLCWIHGAAKEPFDWDQRPWFLRFNTDDAEERQTLAQELAGKLLGRG